ncbi:MAG: energy transducer TonB [Ferruginibacter sp.]
MYKAILLLSLIAFFSLGAYSQNAPRTDTSINKNGRFSNYLNNAEVVLTAAYHKASFDSTQKKWPDYLHGKLNPAVPLIYKAPTGNYAVSIQFAIDKDGNIKNLRAESNCGYGLEDEVIRCIKGSPKWNPAMTKSGEKIGTVSRQTIVFIVNKMDVKIVVR